MSCLPFGRVKPVPVEFTIYREICDTRAKILYRFPVALAKIELISRKVIRQYQSTGSFPYPEFQVGDPDFKITSLNNCSIPNKIYRLAKRSHAFIHMDRFYDCQGKWIYYCLQQGEYRRPTDVMLAEESESEEGYKVLFLE